jgi:hypothetical protein
MKLLIAVLFIGSGATLVVDAWAWLRRAAFGTPMPDYALVGRWFGYLFRGRFRHAPITTTAALRGERPLGWIVHYAVGVLFAGILVAVWGIPWLRHPTPGPAVLVGVATVLAPWLVLQPAFGAGLAARLTPQPHAARLQSLLTHFWFGVGLYVAAIALQPLFPF